LARELENEREVGGSRVLQELKLEKLTVRERGVGCSPVVQDLNLYSDRWKSLSCWSARDNIVFRGDDIPIGHHGVYVEWQRETTFLGRT
jgi:hypothetical protein